MQMTTATDTHTQYVILTALPRRQWLRERESYFVSTLYFSLRCPPVRGGKDGLKRQDMELST